MKFLGHDDQVNDDELLHARVRAARQNGDWQELDPVDLVPREHGLYVSASTDRVYKLHTGAVFEENAITILGQPGLRFFVADGQLFFVEQMPGSWSMRVQKKALREARA